MVWKLPSAPSQSRRRRIDARAGAANLLALAVLAFGCTDPSDPPLPVLATDALPTSAKPYCVQMHLHGHSHHNGDPQPGSMQWHSHFAARHAFDVLWWSDHSEMFDLTTPLEIGFGSASKDEPSSALERRAAGHQADDGLTLELVSAPAADVDWISRQLGKLPGRANLVARSVEGGGGADVVYEIQGPTGRPRGFQLPRPISSGAVLALDLRAWANSGDARIEIRVGLSWHHRGGPQRHSLRYVLSSRPGRESRALPSGDMVVVRVPVTGDRQWLLLDLEEDAALLRDGLDNTITAVEVRLWARDGARAALELFGIELFSQSPEPEHQLAQIRRFASTYAEEYRHAQLVGVEFLSHDPEVVHLNAFLPEGELTGELARGDESTWNDPSEFVERVRRRGGVVSLNHMFGTTAGKAKPPWQAKLSQRKVRELLRNRAHGAEVLEVGYSSRGGVGLDYHLRTWDALTARGLFLYGNGVSDTHGGPWGPAMLPNRFATWIWAESPGAEDLISAVRGGHMVFGDPFAYRGAFHFEVGKAKMGDRVRVRKAPQPLRLGLDEAFDPELHRLFLVQGRIRREAAEVLYLSQNEKDGHRLELPLDREFMIDVSQPCFVRLELRDRNGTPLLFTNPIVFDRKRRLPA